MERLFERLGSAIENRRRVIVISSVVLLAASLYGATQLGMETGTETFLSTESAAYKDFERFNEHFGSSVIVVMITGESMDQLLRPENIEAMDRVETQLGADPDVISAVGPAFLLKQGVAYLTGTEALPDSQQMRDLIVRDPQTGDIRTEFREVLPDDEHAIIPIVLKGMYWTGDDVTRLIEDTERAVDDAGFVGVRPAVTGEPAFMVEIKDMMTRNMTIMFAVSMVLMLIVLALIFSVRGFFAWRWLPLGMVGIGIVYAFGAAGVLSLPITMVSMSAFPILIGLGVDYSIQLQSRYDEGTREGKSASHSVRLALAKVGPSIGIALVAVCLGFAALLFSPVPMIRDFGVMLLIGAIACCVVALTLPLALLHWRYRQVAQAAVVRAVPDRPSQGAEGWVEASLCRLAPWVISKRVVIVPMAIALTVAGLAYDSSIKTETDETNMISERVEAMRDFQTMRETMIGTTVLNVLVEAEDVTEPDTLSWIAGFEERITTELADNVCAASSIVDLVLLENGGALPQSSAQARQCLMNAPEPIRRNLVSQDHTAANMAVRLYVTEQEGAEQTREVRGRLVEYASQRPDDISVAITGSHSLGVDLLDAFTSGRLKITIMGVGLVFVGLFVLFRLSIIKAVTAVLPIALIVGWSSGIMYLSDIKYSPLTACLGALILGIGVEYTVLLMRRYYEERAMGVEASQAMTIAMTRVGRAIMASGLTTACGFAALLAATDFLILRDFGLMTVINVSLALVSTLVVLPPLLVWADSWQNRRRAVMARYSLDEVASQLDTEESRDAEGVTVGPMREPD